MLQVRKGSDRGHADHGWLNTYHTFSFADFYDPAQMGFRALRVINEDRVAPGMGFGAHGHRDMEIISYVLEGALENRDSLGNGSVLRPGEFQRMSAGTGVTHSEFNPSDSEPVHFYQIWLLPKSNGIEPSYEQRLFPEEELSGKLRLVASPDCEAGSLAIHQDAKVYLARLEAGQTLPYELPTSRFAWLQVLRGRLAVNGIDVNESDGLAAADERHLEISAVAPSELMLFDLP